MTLLSTFEDDFRLALQDAGHVLSDVDIWAGRIASLLKSLEDSHHQAVDDLARGIAPHHGMLASGLQSKLQAARAGVSLPDASDSELGYVLYYLKHPPQAIDAELRAHKVASAVWDGVLAAAPDPILTPEDIDALKGLLPTAGDALATSDGTIIGFGQYEQLDPGWAWTIVNRILNWVCGTATFATTDTFTPIQLTGTGDNVRIAVIGDWGTGTYTESDDSTPGGPAAGVMRTVAQLKPDYLIHVGDTYYAGTNNERPPANEERDNLVNLWKELAGPAFPPGRFFTLNSNHEMYGGALGLYDVALADSMFEAQGGLTYFALEYGPWLIGCFDSAYFSPSVTYLQGGLGDRQSDPAQYRFLSQFKGHASANGQQTILMCHHNAVDTFGTKVEEPLWSNVTETITPDYWYWGHIHLGAVYSDKATVWDTVKTKSKVRCIGHSAIPIAVPFGFEEASVKKNALWYASTPLMSSTGAEGAPAGLEWQPRIKNGFAMITLKKDGSIIEETYDQGSTVPVWSSLG